MVHRGFHGNRKGVAFTWVVCVLHRGALVVVGNVTVDADFLSVGMEVSFETEAALDFITTVQFSEYPFLVCMQMDKTTFPFRWTPADANKTRLRANYVIITSLLAFSSQEALF